MASELRAHTRQKGAILFKIQSELKARQNMAGSFSLNHYIMLDKRFARGVRREKREREDKEKGESKRREREKGGANCDAL